MLDATPTTMPPDPGEFERAPLVAPAPLVRWLEDSDRADGGHREAFFTGRDAEFEMFFRGLRGLAHGRVGGQALVYQGAPGAGKSAMVNEFAAAVEAHSKPGAPWVPVRLSPGTLASPFDAARKLLDATNAEVERMGRGVDGWVNAWRNALDELRARGGGAGGVRVGAGRSPDSAQGAFSAVAPAIARAGARLVVFVDEAQNIPPGAEDVLWCPERRGYRHLPVTGVRRAGQHVGRVEGAGHVPGRQRSGCCFSSPCPTTSEWRCWTKRCAVPTRRQGPTASAG